MNMSIRFSLRSTVLILAWLASATVLATDSCSKNSSWGGVFSVIGNGVIDVANGNTGENDQCNTIFYNGSTVNAQNGKYISSGTATNGKSCKDYESSSAIQASTPSGYVTASGKTVTAPTLDTFQPSTSLFDVKFPNSGQVQYGNTAGQSDNINSTTVKTLTADGRSVVMTGLGNNKFSLPGGDYDEVETQNGISLVFSGPVRINKLSMSGCNGASVRFAADLASAPTDGTPQQTWVREFNLQAECNIFVAGPTKTTLNIKGTNSSGGVVGWTIPSATCVNYEPCDARSTKSWENMSSQHPELLRLNLYNGTLNSQDSVSISGQIYVANGDVNLKNGTPVTVVGEILANSIYTQNNSGTQLFYKPSSSVVLKTQSYSLTPPVTDVVTTTGSLVYRALQRDYRADNKTPGTSGHLMAFRLKADSSQETDPVWDAATQMTSAIRSARLFTENSSTLTLRQLSTSLTSAKAEACAVDPTQSECRIASDARDPSSFVGVPWRIAPVIAGNAVLFATDDGILYSVNKATGALNWGWIPSATLERSLDVARMLREHPWGQLAVAEVPAVGGNDLYVTGVALGGQVHFSLKLSRDGSSLEKIVWLDRTDGEYSPGSAAVNVGNAADGAGWAAGVGGRPFGGAAPVSSASDIKKVAYVRGGKLITRSLISDSAAVVSTFSGSSASSGDSSSSASTLPVPNSNLLYIDDSRLFFGASNGKVYQTKANGALVMGSTSVDKVSLGSDPVWFVSGAFIASASGNGLMLLAQSARRVNAVKFMSDAWSLSWYTGFTSSGLGESSPTTNPKIGTAASDNAYFSASADIISNTVVLYYTTQPDACTIKAYAYGPLKLLDGTDATGNSEYRLTSMSSLSNYIGAGEATGGYATRFRGKQGILVGSGGDGSTIGDTAAITPPTLGVRERLNWRELTNFF